MEAYNREEAAGRKLHNEAEYGANTWELCKGNTTPRTP